MKKKVLCVFSMILLALVTCTILSMKIEEEMTLEAIGWDVKSDYNYNDIPSSMMFTDENGSHAYEIFEGTGWESGLRAREVLLSGDKFYADRDYIIVRGASRQPVYGELARLYDGTETAPSTYLAVYPGGVPEENDLLFQAEILEQSEHVLLLHVQNGIQPFTENRAKNGLIQLASGNWRIYSLEALTQLLESIPMAIASLMIVAALAVFGIQSCALARNLKRNKWLLWFNGFLIIALLGGLIWTLTQIDLPASMLPSENIFRVKQYKTLCGEIFQALNELANVTTRTCLALRARALQEGILVLLLGSVGVLSIFVCELIWIRRKRTGKHAYSGKYLPVKQ